MDDYYNGKFMILFGEAQSGSEEVYNFLIIAVWHNVLLKAKYLLANPLEQNSSE